MKKYAIIVGDDGEELRNVIDALTEAGFTLVSSLQMNNLLTLVGGIIDLNVVSDSTINYGNYSELNDFYINTENCIILTPKDVLNGKAKLLDGACNAPKIYKIGDEFTYKSIYTGNYYTFRLIGAKAKREVNLLIVDSNMKSEINTLWNSMDWAKVDDLNVVNISIILNILGLTNEDELTYINGKPTGTITSSDELKKGDVIRFVKFTDLDYKSWQGNIMRVEVVDGPFISVRNLTSGYFNGHTHNFNINEVEVELDWPSKKYIADNK